VSKRATVRRSDLAQPACARHRIYEQREQLFVAPSRQLERVELRRDGVGLRGSSGAGAGASGAPLEARDEQARAREPFEPSARNVAVNSRGGRKLVGGYRLRLPTCEQQRFAESWIDKPVE
jgi:hypothetical protein